MQLNMLQDVYFHQHGPIKYIAQILTLEYVKISLVFDLYILQT